MNVDTLSIIVKSTTDKLTSGIKNGINVFTQYSKTLDKVTNSMNKVASGTSNADNNFVKSKQRIKEISAEYERLSSIIKKYSPTMGVRSDFAQYTKYPIDTLKSALAGSTKERDALIYKDRSEKEEKRLSTVSADITDVKSAIKFVEELGMSYDEVINKIKEYKEQLEQANISNRKESQKISISKDSTQGLKDIGREARNTHKKISSLSLAMGTLGTVAKSVGSKGFDFLKNKFKDFTSGFGKNVNSNIKEIKKLALGLIGVRTAMSVLTKSVNAYLSFDSELQDSLSNSWNMLGSLLAPAIEFVARMFAIATNYVAQFVNALTGINLVARANTKALQTQAKANAKANEAQRGLLGMDEITNLPTEPSGGAGSSAPQIQMDDSIKSFKALDDILNHLKNGEWHLVGEDIAKGINKLLYSINWKDVKKRAYNFGYNFADFLNGLFEVDWSQIGTTMAETYNTWTSLVKGFVDKFSFIQLGGGLARMLNHAFLDIDWNMLAETINTGFTKIGSGITIFLTTFKWGDIGLKFGEFVASIDWGNLLFIAIKNSVLLAKGILEFLAGFLVGLFWDLIEPVKEPFVAFGDFLYSGINGLINTVFSSITPVINFISNSFRTLVGAIKSLLQGDLLGAVISVGKGIANALASPINRFIDGLNGIISPIMDLIQAILEATGKKINLKKLRIPRIPTLATGTPNIETEGLYHLHEGEMVVPKRYNPNTDGYDNGMDNRQIIDLLVSLNASMLEYAERPININMNSRKVAEATYDDMQQIDRNRNKSTAVVRS